MADAGAAAEFRILIKNGLEVLHDDVYVLDFDAPNFEQFDLTPSERRRCEELLSAAVELWVQSTEQRTQSDEMSEPVRALLEAMVTVISETLKRTVESRSSLRSLAVAQ